MSFKNREQRRPAVARNEIWSIDFVADQLADGRRFRALTVIDVFKPWAEFALSRAEKRG
jgi:hypothetical protein